ncbi:MAG: hypothetical protein ABS82_04335 [Rhodanobacter sp. SCN 67-45]|jgi:hypothetical protein|nr:MAG: hypothetical protein ABS82_04335 [Rhodanobacter sp. SCN 67-45]
MGKTGLADPDLFQSVIEMEAGLIDADLGGQLVKKRIALPGRGKRGGARTIVATNRGDRWYFIFGFGKNERANIDKHELRALQELASDLLGQDDKALAAALEADELVEVDHD